MGVAALVCGGVRFHTEWANGRGESAPGLSWNLLFQGKEAEDGPGWVIVTFGDDAQDYRIGDPQVDNGICDLELADEGDYSGTVLVMLEGKLMELVLPDDLAVSPGDTVKLSPESKQIVARVDDLPPRGDIAVVAKVLDDHAIEISVEGAQNRVISTGRFGGRLETADRVVVDSHHLIVLENLGKDEQRFALKGEREVGWDEIGGQAELKAEIRDLIEAQFADPDLFRSFGLEPVHGLLFFGPPGCGKTMYGMAIAKALREFYRGEWAPSAFLYMRGPEILDKWVGSSEAQIRWVFEMGRRHQEQYGYPSVLFLDEAEAILKRRGSGISSDVETTIVPAFLSEMNGLKESGTMVVLATNRVDVLDEAAVRECRINRRLYVGRPDQAAAEDIFGLHLKTAPLNGESREELAAIGARELFGEKRVLYDLQFAGGRKAGFLLKHIASGAMIKGVCDQARRLAFRRSRKERRVSGVNAEDMVRSVDLHHRKHLSLEHKDDLADFVSKTNQQLVRLERPCAA